MGLQAVDVPVQLALHHVLDVRLALALLLTRGAGREYARRPEHVLELDVVLERGVRGTRRPVLIAPRGVAARAAHRARPAARRPPRGENVARPRQQAEVFEAARPDVARATGERPSAPRASESRPARAPRSRPERVRETFAVDSRPSRPSRARRCGETAREPSAPSSRPAQREQHTPLTDGDSRRAKRSSITRERGQVSTGATGTFSVREPWRGARRAPFNRTRSTGEIER